MFMFRVSKVYFPSFHVGVLYLLLIKKDECNDGWKAGTDHPPPRKITNIPANKHTSVAVDAVSTYEEFGGSVFVVKLAFTPRV